MTALRWKALTDLEMSRRYRRTEADLKGGLSDIVKHSAEMSAKGQILVEQSRPAIRLVGLTLQSCPRYVWEVMEDLTWEATGMITRSARIVPCLDVARACRVFLERNDNEVD